MKLRAYKAALRDLFRVLPTVSRRQWSSTDNLSVDQCTVVLISGFAATRRHLSVIKRRLERDGFNVLILSLDWATLSDVVRGLRRLAEKLSSLILQLKKNHATQHTPVHLIAHSAGGLVARHYIQRLGGDHYCNGLITLGTPHLGTWVAALGFLTHLALKARCLYQMLPFSKFLYELNRAPLPSGFPVVCIYSKDDVLCHGRSASCLGPSSPDVKCVELEGISHGELLISKRVYAELLKNLPSSKSDAQPRQETRVTG